MEQQVTSPAYDESTAPVRHNEPQQQFEVIANGMMGVLTYAPRGEGVVVFDHTFVPDKWRGKGVAGRLAAAAFDEARKRGWKVVPHCSYISDYVRRKREYADLIHE